MSQNFVIFDVKNKIIFIKFFIPLRFINFDDLFTYDYVILFILQY